MLVIFLDIDGVLNRRAYLLRVMELHTRIVRGDRIISHIRNEEMIDPQLVAELNRIVQQTGAVIVISSTWRHNHDPAEMQQLLRLQGFTGDVICETPHRPEDLPIPPVGVRVRGHEIQAWLDDHPGVEQFIILDDDEDDMAHLGHRLVRTTFEHGLTHEHVKQAIDMLFLRDV